MADEGGDPFRWTSAGSARLIQVSPAASPVVISNNNSQESSDFEIIGMEDGEMACCLDVDYTPEEKATKALVYKAPQAPQAPQAPNAKKLRFGEVTTCDTGDIELHEIVPDIDDIEPRVPKAKKLRFGEVTTCDTGDIELHEIVPDIDDIEPTSAEQNHVESAHQDDGSPEVRDLWVMRNPGITQELATPLADLDSGSSTLRLRSATISRDMLKDVLDTRPTLQMGRGMSMKFRARSAFSRRGESVHSSLPTRTKSAVTAKNEALQRSYTLPGNRDVPRTTITVEDIEDDEIFDEDDEEEDEEERNYFKDLPFYRQTTRRLKERMDIHREQQLAQQSVVRESVWQNFKYVKWPKVKSQWKVIRSWELWKGHMKTIEGHFGTAIVSYFIFLRFLFLVNLVIFALWFGFVVIPGIVYVFAENPPRTESLATCVYETASFPDILCPADIPETALAETSLTQESVFYQLVSPGAYSCSDPSTGSSFNVRNCDFGSADFNSSLSYRVAQVEGGTDHRVSTVRPTTTCDNSSAAIIELRLCTSGISPRILWYNYIVDFFLGQGIYNDTILFYGRYGNGTVLGTSYSLPLAYLLTTFVIYGISIVLLVITLGNAYNESYTKFSSRRKAAFSSKVFTAWDFNITDVDTAKLKKVHIRTDLEEELADYDKKKDQRTRKDWAKVITIRFFTNLFTFLVLVGASAAIYYSADYGLRNEGSTFPGLVLPVVITTLNFILPLVFSFLARFERFKTQSGEIKMTLLRTIIVRLSSLIVLIVTLFILVSCSQTVTMDTTSTICSFSAAQSLTSAVTSNTSDCPICWETYIGTEFYTLGITNFVVSASATIAAETGRNIVSRIKFKGLGDKIGKGNFNIPKSILDLIYTQALLWLGFFFCPVQPIVIMATTFMLFYVKRYSLTCNLVPDKRGSFRAARTNFLFVFLMLLTLFLILLPIGFVIASFNPSETCGPFRGNQNIFSIIDDGIATLSCTSQQFFDFVSSFGFILFVIVLLLLIIYALIVSLHARHERFKLIKKQLVLEGANVTHIVNKLDAVLNSLDSDSADGKHPTGDIQQKNVIRQKIVDIRHSLNDQTVWDIEDTGSNF